MDFRVSNSEAQPLVQVCMVAKNFYMGSNTKISLPPSGSNEVDTTQQNGGADWFLVRTNLGIYSKKMGEITAKLLNILGITGAIFGFIANLPNAISVAIGLMSVLWLTYRILEKREDWLMKRSQRRKHERDNNTTEP